MKLTDLKVGNIVKVAAFLDTPSKILRQSSDTSTSLAPGETAGVIVDIKSSRSPGDPLGFISVLTEGKMLQCLPGELTVIYDVRIEE